MHCFKYHLLLYFPSDVHQLVKAISTRQMFRTILIGKSRSPMGQAVIAMF